MEIIGLHGKIGSGKDTVGRVIQILTSQQYYDSLDTVLNGSRQKEDILKMDWDRFLTLHEDKSSVEFYNLFKSWEIKRFAFTLKKAVSAITGVSLESLNDNEFKKTKDPYINKTYRKILQDVGNVLRQDIHEDIWVDSVLRNLQEDSKWIFVDVRYMNEYEALLDYNSLIVKIIGTEQEEKSENNHVSETQLDSIEDHNFDFVIDNSNREDGFKPLVGQVFDFLKENNLIPK